MKSSLGNALRYFVCPTLLVIQGTTFSSHDITFFYMSQNNFLSTLLSMFAVTSVHCTDVYPLYALVTTQLLGVYRYVVFAIIYRIEQTTFLRRTVRDLLILKHVWPKIPLGKRLHKRMVTFHCLYRRGISKQAFDHNEEAYIMNARGRQYTLKIITNFEIINFQVKFCFKFKAIKICLLQIHSVRTNFWNMGCNFRF